MDEVDLLYSSIFLFEKRRLQEKTN